MIYEGVGTQQFLWSCDAFLSVLQRKKMFVDVLVTKLRQESSEENLKMTLEKTVPYLQNIEHRYDGTVDADASQSQALTMEGWTLNFLCTCVCVCSAPESASLISVRFWIVFQISLRRTSTLTPAASAPFSTSTKPAIR